MISDKTIVVAAHGDDARTRDAVALGTALARAESARLVLAGIWESPLGAGDALYESLVREEMRRELEAVRSSLPDDITAEVLVRGSTSIARGLHRVVADHHRAILVLGPSHLGRGARAVRGDRVLALLHDAPCAIAVAPEGLRHRAAGSDVVVGWDGSPESQEALEAGVLLARDAELPLRIVHVIETPYPADKPPLFGADRHAEWSRSVRATAQESLESAARQVGHRVPVMTELRGGSAPEELASASRDAAYLVVGSRGYGSVRRVVLGSVSAAVLRRCTSPVLVLPRGVIDREEAADAALTG